MKRLYDSVKSNPARAAHILATVFSGGQFDCLLSDIEPMAEEARERGQPVQVKFLHGQGLTVRQISSVTGIQEGRVRSILGWRGLRCNPVGKGDHRARVRSATMRRRTRELHAEGYANKEIAAILQCSRASIAAYLRNMRLTPNRYDADRGGRDPRIPPLARHAFLAETENSAQARSATMRRRTRELHAEGYANKEIAAILQCSRASIAAYLRNMRLTPNKYDADRGGRDPRIPPLARMSMLAETENSAQARGGR